MSLGPRLSALASLLTHQDSPKTNMSPSRAHATRTVPQTLAGRSELGTNEPNDQQASTDAPVGKSIEGAPPH